MILAHDDLLKLITADAATVDVTVSYVDDGANPSVPRNQQTAITTATTTTVLATPGAGTSRTIRSVSIRNKDTASCTVTPAIVGSSITTQLHRATLAGGGQLHWTEGSGWNATSAATLGVTTTVILAGDIANANASANTIADITGLSFPVTSGQTYWFRFVIPYTSAATTTGCRFAVNGPATPTALSYRSTYPITATTMTTNFATAYDIPAAANTDTLTAGATAIIEGEIKPSADGTVIARFASEVTVSAITALAGSLLEWKRVL